MAIEFNITTADKFFLGEDKIVELTIFGQDNVTPLDVTTFLMEWNMRKTDKAGDPALLTKGLASGLTIIGAYNVIPASNTQRVRLTFASADTDAFKADITYRHSLKRIDPGFEGILSYGALNFLQATEH